MVECDLAKVEVAGSNPVSRSNLYLGTSSPVPLHAHSRGPYSPAPFAWARSHCSLALLQRTSSADARTGKEAGLAANPAS